MTVKREKDQMKIEVGHHRVITRKEFFEDNEKFHREQAKLPFEEKIKILIKLQEIAVSIKGESGIRRVWPKD